MAAPATRDPFLAAPHAAPGSSPPTLNAAPGGFLGLEGGGGGWAATLSPSYPLRPSVRPSVGPSVPPVGCRLPPAEKLPGPEIGRAGSDPPGFKGVWWCAAPPPPAPLHHHPLSPTPRPPQDRLQGPGRCPRDRGAPWRGGTGRRHRSPAKFFQRGRDFLSLIVCSAGKGTNRD